MKSTFPIVTDKTDAKDILRKIVRARIEEDLPGWNNLPNRFIAGRSTYRIPATSSDVLTTDKVGDLVNDSLYQYRLTQYTTAVVKWDRRALTTSW